MGCDQRFHAPPPLSVNTSALSSGAQSRQKSSGSCVAGRSNVFVGVPPARGMIANLGGPDWLDQYRQAIRSPSREILGWSHSLSVSWIGAPPPVGTFHSLSAATYTIHFPSKEQRGVWT